MSRSFDLLVRAAQLQRIEQSPAQVGLTHAGLSSSTEQSQPSSETEPAAAVEYLSKRRRVCGEGRPVVFEDRHYCVAPCHLCNVVLGFPPQAGGCRCFATAPASAARRPPPMPYTMLSIGQFYELSYAERVEARRGFHAQAENYVAFVVGTYPGQRTQDHLLRAAMRHCYIRHESGVDAFGSECALAIEIAYQDLFDPLGM